MAPPKDLLHQTYETMKAGLHIPDQFTTASQAEELLITWSRIVENSVGKALQIQHVVDPLHFPVPCLPSSYKGRCRPQQRTAIQPKTSVKNDRHQGHQPPSEVFSCKNKQKVRQVRRIKSLLRALKSHCNRYDLASRVLPDQQLINEWQAIRSARGYGHRWDHWILAFDLIPYIPCDLPEYGYLELMGQITEWDCNVSCRYETTQRRANFQSQIKIDNAENFGKLTYRILKAKSNISLDEVPYQISTMAKLLRSTKGQQQIKTEEFHPFPKGSHLFFWRGHNPSD